MKRVLVIVVPLVVLAALASFFLLRKGKDTPAASEEKTAARARSTTGGTGGSSPDFDVLFDDDREGTLRLEGQVLTPDQLPVGGALVSIDTNPPRQAVTEADGSFYFDKLMGRRYRLVARSDQGAGGPVTARLTETSDPVIITLKPAAAVEITVVTTDRAPLAGATVELRGLALDQGLTSDAGVARFEAVPAGGYQVAAYAPGHAKTLSWIRVPPGNTVTKETLVVKRGAAVSGRVTDESGKAVAGARVAYSGVADWVQQASQRFDAVVTDEDGRFRFDALPAGSFRFVARHEAYAPGESDLVTLDGKRERAGVEIVLEGGAVLAGKVVRGDGSPAPFAAVRVAVATEGFRFEEARQTFADEGGRFEMTGLPRKKVQAVALHESAASETVDVDLEAQAHKREVTLTLDLEGLIAGIVLGPDGQPVPDAEVTAFPDMRAVFGAMMGAGDDEAPARGDRASRREARQEARQQLVSDFRLRGMPTERTDAGGRFEIRGLRAGTYSLRASPPGVPSRRRPRFGARGGVRAEVGDTDVEIRLEDYGGIKGRVAFADGNTPDVFTVGMGFRGGTPFSSSDGSFVLEDLEPGEVDLMVRGPGFEPARVPDVKIEEGKITDVGTITVREGRKIVGKVVDKTGAPVGGARVYAGRIVFGSGASAGAGNFGGPRGAGLAKETTTDEYGEFSLYGVTPGDVALVAEHEEKGRSQSTRIDGPAQPVTTITLVLVPFGALEGVVKKDGKPAEGVLVNAEAQKAPGVLFGVMSGKDGKFRFDRLAADVYVVSAMSGFRRMGMAFHQRTVRVEMDKTSYVELTVAEGTGSIVATLVPPEGETAGFSLINVVQGPVKAQTFRELDYESNALGEGLYKIGFAFPGQPGTVSDLAPGEYTVCAVPVPLQVMRPPDAMEYLQREGDNLPIFCKPATVTEGETPVTIPIEIPDYVPPPPPAGG